MAFSIKSTQNNDSLRQRFLKRQAQQQALVSNQEPTNYAQNTKPQDQTQSSDKVASANPPPNAALPWGAMMGAMGLSPQGSKDDDLAAIREKLDTMATDPTKKSQIANLEEQYNGYKAVAANMQPPVQQNQTALAASQMTGATQAGLNNLALIEIRKKQPEMA